MLMLLLTAAATTAGMPRERQKHVKHTDMETLQLTAEWDKTFPQSDKVLHTKITFHNRYGITLAADLYKPRGATGRLAAIAVCGPYGAVKEQVSGLYAQTLAERGFLTLAFDPSFCGESGGEPRCLTSPEISTDDFSAAVDCLLRIAQVYDIPIANNKATADFMIHSELMDEEYNHNVINFNKNIRQRASTIK